MFSVVALSLINLILLDQQILWWSGRFNHSGDPNKISKKLRCHHGSKIITSEPESSPGVSWAPASAIVSYILCWVQTPINWTLETEFIMYFRKFSPVLSKW